jgi:hypothetical protein
MTVTLDVPLTERHKFCPCWCQSDHLDTAPDDRVHTGLIGEYEAGRVSVRVVQNQLTRQRTMLPEIEIENTGDLGPHYEFQYGQSGLCDALAFANVFDTLGHPGLAELLRRAVELIHEDLDWLEGEQ